MTQTTVTIDTTTSRSGPAAIAGGGGITSDGALGLGRVAGGFGWAILGHGSSIVLKCGGYLILTRLLFPEAFGLLAIIQLVLSGLQMFSDVGLGLSIIRSEDGRNASFFNTAWTIQVIRGFVLWIVALLISWPVSWFYEEPGLMWFIPIAALSAIVAGFNSTSLFTLNRQLLFARLTLVELASSISGLAVMVLWAWLSPSVWSLVAGGIVTAVVRMILSHLILPNLRNAFHWDRQAARSLLNFGKWIFVSTLLTFLAFQADRLIFGKLLDIRLFGVYALAAIIVTLLTQVVPKLNRLVVLPFLSRIHRTGGDLSAPFHRYRSPVVLWAGFQSSVLIVCGPSIIELFFDARYVEAGVIVQFLAAGAWFFMLESMNGALLLAVGDSRAVAAGSLAKVIAIAVLVPGGFIFAGLYGSLVGLVVSDALKYGVSARLIRRAHIQVLMRDLLVTMWLVGTVSAGVICGEHVSVSLESAAYGLGASLVTLCLGWLGLIFICFIIKRARVCE